MRVQEAWDAASRLTPKGDREFVDKEDLRLALHRQLQLNLDELQDVSDNYAVRASGLRRSRGVTELQAIEATFRQAFIAGALWEKAKGEDAHEGPTRTSP